MDRFLARLLSRQNLSSPVEGDKSVNPLFSEQFLNVQTKVKMLAESLNEVNIRGRPCSPLILFHQFSEVASNIYFMPLLYLRPFTLLDSFGDWFQ